MKRRPPEGIDRDIGGGLGEGDLAGGRAGGEGLRDGAGALGEERPEMGQASGALARAETGPARPLE